MANGLPLFSQVGGDTSLLMNGWYKVLNPFFKQALSAPVILKNISLVSGANTVKHGLGYPLTGWQIIRKRIWESAGTITSYDVMDEQDQNLLVTVPVQANVTPQNTLILFCTQGTTANPVIVDILVF